MKLYNVKNLSKLAGVSVRTLHIYDKMGLLKPAFRTESQYRVYGENELLRLQQILFYRELDLPLKEISEIINKPDFKILSALELHKNALEAKKEKMDLMLNTIEKTIFKLKNNIEMKHEELYEGISNEQAATFRNEAIEKWGKETIEKSEEQLYKLSKSEMEKLKTDFMAVNKELSKCFIQNPESREVQLLVSKHYQFICKFWGSKPSKEAYIGLGEMYIADDRYTTIENKPSPEFAKFMCEAMAIYANNNLI
jgi:DNA-binding transcriptional MerR regulator